MKIKNINLITNIENNNTNRTILKLSSTCGCSWKTLI